MKLIEEWANSPISNAFKLHSSIVAKMIGELSDILAIEIVIEISNVHFFLQIVQV